jgi:hypothetical protein
VAVKGEIVRLIPPRAGSKAPWTILLADAGAERPVTLWASEYEEAAGTGFLAPGRRVRLLVSVNTYHDELQLRLASAADIQAEDESTVPAAAPPAATDTPLALSRIDPGLASEWVTTEGTVEDVQTPVSERAPHKVVLADAGAKVHVVYWDDVAGELRANQPRPGRRLRVRGQVGVFREELQIKVDAPENIILLEETP